MSENENYLSDQDVPVAEPSIDEPTAEFFKEAEASERAVPLPRPIPIPIPWIFGSRFYIWKQDPSVWRLGRRLTYIPQLVINGPRDSRINTQLPGTTPVIRNVSGDFIFGANTPESDGVVNRKSAMATAFKKTLTAEETAALASLLDESGLFTTDHMYTSEGADLITYTIQ